MKTYENPDLNVVVENNNELKKFIIDYVGKKINPEEEEVTVGKIVEVMAIDFPEFLVAVAEENWVRGYHQALVDVDEGQKLYQEELGKEKQQTNQKENG